MSGVQRNCYLNVNPNIEVKTFEDELFVIFQQAGRTHVCTVVEEL